jgi:hypothetical protein
MWPLTCGLSSALGGTRTPNLLIRRSGQAVQDSPPLAVYWIDVPCLSACARRCPACWQQVWQQSPRFLVIGHALQGMACVWPGQAPAWPLPSDRSGRRGSGVKRDFGCALTRAFLLPARCPGVTVTLEAGGADTDTQRANPGPERGQVSGTYLLHGRCHSSAPASSQSLLQQHAARPVSVIERRAGT